MTTTVLVLLVLVLLTAPTPALAGRWLEFYSTGDLTVVEVQRCLAPGCSSWSPMNPGVGQWTFGRGDIYGDGCWQERITAPPYSFVYHCWLWVSEPAYWHRWRLCNAAGCSRYYYEQQLECILPADPRQQGEGCPGWMWPSPQASTTAPCPGHPSDMCVSGGCHRSDDCS